MKRHFFAAIALAALISPLGALAQDLPPGAPDGPPQIPPPPQMRAQLEQARTQAKAASLSDLSADHRAKVQAIIAKVQNGSLDPRDASTQIDALLTPAESQAVLAQAQKMHDAMKKAIANAPPPHRMNRKPDAGRFLIMVSLPPRPPAPPAPPGQP